MNRRPSTLLALVLLGAAVALFFFVHEGGDSSAAGLDPGLSREHRVEEGAGATPGELRLSDAAASSPAEARRVEAQPVEQEERGAKGAFLRVVRDSDGAPMPDMRMRLVLHGPEEIDEAGETKSPVLKHIFMETEADGFLDVKAELDGAGQGRVRSLSLFLLRHEELALEPETFETSLLGASRGEALELRAVEQPVAPIQGVVVDAETGLPLPGLALRLERWIDFQDADGDPDSVHDGGGFTRATRYFEGARTEWVVSDQVGRFTTKRALPSGRVGFETIHEDHADTQHVVAGDGRALEGTLEVSVGPMILLDFDPPGGRQHGDFIAGLWRAPEELTRDGGLTEFSSPWSRGGGTRLGGWGNASAVQGSAPAWFRPSLENVEDSPLPTRVFVASRDGAVLGHAMIHEYERHATEPLRVELTERCGLEGLLLWPEGDEDTVEAEMFLVQRVKPGEDEPGHVASRWVMPWYGEQETPFHFQFVPAGDYDLRISADGIEEQVLDIHLPRVEPLRVELVPRVQTDLHQVEGRVVTASGKPLDGRGGRAKLLYLFVSGVDGAPDLSRVELDWEGGVAQFTLEDVPAGRYRMNSHWPQGGFPIAGLREGFRVPVTEQGGVVELVVADDVASQVLEVRVIEPQAEGSLLLTVQDGGSIEAHSFLQFCIDGDLDEGVTLLDGRRVAMSRYGPYPVGVELELSLNMDGHRSPSMGEEVFGPMDANGVRLAEIRPVEGWSARIHVYEVEQGERSRALEGVELAFDGQAARPTDATGFVYVEASRAPSRIEVLTPGWELLDRSSWTEWGSVMAAQRTFTVEDGQLTVHLRGL